MSGVKTVVYIMNDANIKDSNFELLMKTYSAFSSQERSTLHMSAVYPQFGKWNALDDSFFQWDNQSQDFFFQHDLVISKDLGTYSSMILGANIRT